VRTKGWTIAIFLTILGIVTLEWASFPAEFVKRIHGLGEKFLEKSCFIACSVVGVGILHFILDKTPSIFSVRP
jgi:hypothetical protein